MADFTIFPSNKITRENLMTINRIHQAYDGIVSMEDFPLSYGQEGDNLVVYIGAGRAMVQGRLIEAELPITYTLEVTEDVIKYGAYLKLVLETDGLEDHIFIAQDKNDPYSDSEQGHYEVGLCHVYISETSTGYRIASMADKRRPLNAPYTDITEYLQNSNKDYEGQYASYSLINGIMDLHICAITKAQSNASPEIEICRIPGVDIVTSFAGTIYTAQGVQGVRIYPTYHEDMASVSLLADSSVSYEIDGDIRFPVFVKER